MALSHPWFPISFPPPSVGPYLVRLHSRLGHWCVSAHYNYEKNLWLRPDEEGNYRIPCEPINWSYLP